MAFTYVSHWLKDQSFLKGPSEWHLSMSHWLKESKLAQRSKLFKGPF